MSNLVFEYVLIDDSGEVEMLMWRAGSFYESHADQCDSFEFWEIRCNRYGVYLIDCSDYQMVGWRKTESPKDHATFDAAKAECEQLEIDLHDHFEQLGFGREVAAAVKRRDARNATMAVPA